MDPISGSLALVGTSTKLAQDCMRLYQFWDSLRNAPDDVKVIKNDLMLLTNVLGDISQQKDLSPAVRLTLDSCQEKVKELESIVRELDSNFSSSASKRDHLWTALKITTKSQQFQRFRHDLGSVKSTLMLGLMYQNIQKPRLCFTNQDVEKVTIWSSTTTDTEQQLRNPILTKASTENDAEPPLYSDPSPGFSSEKDSMKSATTTILAPKNHDSSVAAIVSSKAVQGFLQHSLHLAVDNLFASGTVQQLMDTTLNQVTSFDTACSGSYGSESYDIRNMPVSHDQSDPGTDTTGEKPGQRSRFKRPKTCNQSSSMGVVLGSIWIRTSTLRAEEGSNATSGKLEVITSFIFYPASWLTRIGLRYGTEASLKADIAKLVAAEDIDVERVALDPTLGRLWRGWGNSFHGDFSDPTEIATAMSRDSGYASMVPKRLLGGESNESDTKSISSLESHITSASSLNPVGVGGVVEEFAEILMDNEDIRRCVKRGFVAMDSNRFERNFIRLLKSYASELRAEADTHIQKSATRIVHSYRAYVTRIIRRRVVGLDEDNSQATAFHSIKDQNTTKLTLERFLAQQKPTETSDQADIWPEDEQESNRDSHSDDEEPYLPNLEKLTDFLVSSTAFKNFKAGLEAFVESNSELQQALEDSSSRVGESDKHVPIEQSKDPGFLKWVEIVLRRSLRPSIPLGSQRIEWICDCGDLLHMDFNSNSTGSFPTMNALLRFQSAILQVPGSSHAPGRPLAEALSMPMQARSSGNISQNLATQSGPISGLHSSNTPHTSLGAAATASTARTQINFVFLELCVNAGKLLKSLGEIDISSINTDGDFFSTVKAHYLQLRSFRARFWLLKPVTVSYVRFSVEDRCRVGILHKPVALPPKAEVDAKRYHYEPCPLENELPISSDLFLHYLFSCSSPSRNLIWLPRIPRKLDTSILTSPAPASFGWGVHIDEGPDYLKIFRLNLVVLGVSGVTALLWAFFRHDFQGAIGLAAWIVMLLNTLMAVYIAKWSQE